jgi:hypothetical protein
MNRFAPGDLLLAASDVDDSNIDLRNHKGPGRILHVSGDFAPKSMLWTGEPGLLVGLVIDPASKRLYAADPNRKLVFAFDAAGELIGPLSHLPERPYGTVAIAPDGALYLGVHTQRGPAPADSLGGDKLLRISPDGEVLAHFAVDTDGGHTGWHGLTSLAFQDGGRIALYLSEGGKRVLRYDLEQRQQLEDLLRYPETGRRVYGVGTTADAILVAVGDGVLKLSPEGEELAYWPAEPAKGWTRVTPSLDGQTFFLNNFLEGIIERRQLCDGAVLARHDIQRKCALCGVAEIAEHTGEATA